MEKSIQTPPSFCTYLGLRSDPETSLAYPSLAHHCFHCKVPAVPLLQHQENYCLGAAHPSCPVFLQTQQKSFPKQYQAKRQSFLSGQKNLFILLGLLLLMGLVLLASWTTLSTRLFPASQSPLILVTPQNASATPIVQPTDTPNRSSKTPTLTVTATQTSTPAFTATATPVLRGLEILILVENAKFLIHRVRPGENLEKLTKTYTTSSDVIAHINYHKALPLWADNVIILMPGIVTADPFLPTFEAYQIKGGDVSIENLAQKLKIELTILKFYNNCASSCQLSVGDWVLIPHLR